MITAQDVENALTKLGSKEKAKTSSWFFKTGKGHYGEGDIFLGVTVPEQRMVTKQFCSITEAEIKKLLKSPLHECRLTALIILGEQFKQGDRAKREKIVRLYLKHSKRVNNWDLVDASAPQILGTYLYGVPKKERTMLYTLARSSNLWEKRIAIVSTYAFIKQGEFKDTLALSEILLHDTHDLIHKAVGWMLREVGKKDTAVLEQFLNNHAAYMPRTTLRYALEKFPIVVRKRYMAMKGKI